MAPPLWDLFCRVVDHRGDAGVSWRLARNLALRGQRARLWIDDPTALAGMADADDARLADRGALAWLRWDVAAERALDAAGLEGTARVVETFGCGLPPAALRAMARRPDPPPWINVEYLSAEAYVERSHRLPSPQPAAVTGLPRDLTCWFFYPGFTAATGGLLREPGLEVARHGHDPQAWWRGQPAMADACGHLPDPAPAISLFHYPLPTLTRWHRGFESTLGDAPRPLLVHCGAPSTGPDADGEVDAGTGADTESGRGSDEHVPGRSDQGSGAAPLDVAWPWVPQSTYDRLLWSCELNIVRGEDSFVRAQWAGRPFLWHVYRQHDGAHRGKLEAFLDRFLEPPDPGDAATALDSSLADDLRLSFRCLNGFDGPDHFVPALARSWRRRAEWQRHCERWRAHLWQQPDLATQLIAFADGVAAR
jgi:uncharacterized repeat protein (TIGR03837 family)